LFIKKAVFVYFGRLSGVGSSVFVYYLNKESGEKGTIYLLVFTTPGKPGEPGKVEIWEPGKCATKGSL
jgi:hypothetical protein